MASFVRISVLVWADILAGYAVWMMMTYLTNVWGLGFTNAASIVNVFMGLATIMPIGMTFLVDAFMGDYYMLLLSSLAYSMGLTCLTISTLLGHSKPAGNHGAHQPDHVGNTQQVLFYAALALIAVGISGHMTSLMPFWSYQMEEERNGQNDGEWKRPWQWLGIVAIVIFSITGGFALPYIKSWSIRFGITAICTVIATLLFLSGSQSYKHYRPQGSPFTILFRVFVASASKMFLRLPSDPNQLYESCDHGNQFVPHTRGLRFSLSFLYERRGCDVQRLPHTPGLRCLDKAAINTIMPTQTPEQQNQNRWKLCTVTEVEETKITIRMIPVWMTFIMCGVVSSIGNTYFLDQANSMDRKVGSLKVPLPILLIFHDMAKSLFSKYYVKIAKRLIKRKMGEFAPPMGFAVAMILSILCCITAAKVETRRLDVIKSHHLLAKPSKKIPMSIFWMVPQFVLLGAFNGIYDWSTAHFFIDQVPRSMFRYLLAFSKGVLGAGFLGSVLSVYVVGKVEPTWFQHTLHKSHLDKYYWVLAVLSSINLCVHVLVASQFAYQKSTLEDIRATGNETSAQQFNDNPQCCFCC